MKPDLLFVKVPDRATHMRIVDNHLSYQIFPLRAIHNKQLPVTDSQYEILGTVSATGVKNTRVIPEEILQRIDFFIFTEIDLKTDEKYIIIKSNENP